MNIDILNKVLNCPKCRKYLRYESGKISCPVCGKDLNINGRLLDFSDLTPEIPTEFAKYYKGLLDLAGEKCPDVPKDWRVKSVLDMVHRTGGGEICLEIGGADGPMTPVLESLYKTVFTLDVGNLFLKRIEKKTKKTVCLRGDAHFLPIADKSIGIVICSEVLEHVLIPMQVLLEIRRVLNNDGKLILSVPNEATKNPLTEIIHVLHGQRKEKEQQLLPTDSHVNFYNAEILKKLFFHAGFELVELEDLYRPLIFKPTLRGFRGFVSSFLRRLTLTPEFVLCCVKTMDKTDIYWCSLEQKLMKIPR